MATKQVLYRIEFEGAQEQVDNLTKIGDELLAIRGETKLLADAQKVLRANDQDLNKEQKARMEQLKVEGQIKSQLYRKEQQALKDQKVSTKAVADSLEDLRIKARQYSKELEKIPIGSKEFVMMASKVDLVNRKIRESDKSAGNFKSNIGNYAGSIGDAFQGMGANVSGITSSLGAATMATGPLGVGFAVIAGGAKLFGAAMSATNDVSDKFAVVMGQAKAATSVLFKAIATGDFSNLIGNMRTAIALGEEYTKILDDLSDRKLALSVQESYYSIELAKQKKILQDTSYTDAERIKAAKEVLRIETLLAQKRVDNATISLNAETKYAATINGLSKDRLKDLVQNYDKYSKQIEWVSLLQKKESELAAERQRNSAQVIISGDQAVRVTVTQSQRQVELEKMVTSLRKSTAGYSKDIKAFGKVSDEERNKIGSSLIELYNSQSQFDEKTKEAATQLGALMNKVNKGRIGGSESVVIQYDKELTKLKDLTDEINKLQIVSTKGANFKDPKLRTGAVANYDFGTDGNSLSDRRASLEEKFNLGLVSQKQYKDESNALVDEYNQYVYNSAVGAAQQFVDVWAQAYANQTESRTLELDRQLQAGIISEETYNKKVGELKVKQAKREKAASIVQTVINTAQSIVKTGADLGYPQAIPFQVLAGIIGVAQASLIASQPIREYAEGGLIAGGRPHSQGGTKFVGSDGSAFEAEQGEYIAVVNKHDTPRLRQLSDINSRHGRSFYGQPAGSYFATGGIFQPNQNIGNGNQESLIRAMVSQIGSIPVEVSLNEIESKSSLKRKVNVIGSL